MCYPQPRRVLLTGPLQLLLLLTVSAWAQSGRKVPPHAPVPIVRIETTEVQVPLSAYSADGRSVSDLSPEDVIVLEEWDQREITSLRREPAGIVLVLDLANDFLRFKNGSAHRLKRKDAESIAERMKKPVWEPMRNYKFASAPAAREFAENFVAGLSEGDQLAILEYSDRVQLVQDWTMKKKDAIRSLATNYRAGLHSRFYDALLQASAKLKNRPGRKVIVLLSDGLDGASRGNRWKALEEVTRSGASVFVVEWRDVLTRAVYEDAMNMDKDELSESPWFIQFLAGLFLRGIASSSGLDEYLARLDRVLEVGSRELATIAEKSGGQVLYPANYDQLVVLPERLHREIRSQYSLSFTAERPFDFDEERQIEVIPVRPGLTLRARRSYYAIATSGR